MAKKPAYLIKLFQSVTEPLAGNQDVLNQADTFKHDHGNNMVEVFEVVTQAMKEKRGASAADQLAHASQLLRQRESGSARLYAGGLSQAERVFEGKKVTSDNVLQLVETLVSGGQAATAQQPTLPAGSAASLFGGILEAGQGSAPSAIDIGDLLGAGMSFLNARQSGQGDVDALMGALIAGTQGGRAPYRAQSGAVVANALLQAIGGLSARK